VSRHTRREFDVAEGRILDAAREVVRSFTAGEEDRSDCPYNRRGFGGDPNGTCSYGCQTEPDCHTSGPYPLTALALAFDNLDRLVAENDAIDEGDGQAWLAIPLHLVANAGDRKTICGDSADSGHVGYSTPEFDAHRVARGKTICPTCWEGRNQ
jgi:hypothetical protein